ncbi:proton-conducting transporter transmembrane domain-containing protein [Geoalkalibacter sp.]|uniref:proton-conducting transporter transmembrane domain-containing protein n=1 Tax=Geoalkalibacter sp. TaxID=3041440 RepID=UPI00272DDCEE|nr:proton-conducting transporter membrane subunit [Geoalkalibacter sp.]
MGWFVAGLLLLGFSGVPGLFAARAGGGAEKLACLLVWAGAACGTLAVWEVLKHGVPLVLDLPWAIPGGALALRVDALAAVFLLPLFLVAASGALYGLAYWPQRAHPGNGRRLRLFFGLISAGVMLLLSAANSLLFLLAWEFMALSGFFLITTEEHQSEAREAGFIYLVATHTGTLALFALFALLEQAAGSLLFPGAGALTLKGAEAAAIFLLGLFGFGLKAGLVPLHIWLPGAHAAAPSHASALLSGVMIKTGIYGLTRLTSFFAEIPPWWGATLLALGILSGILGVALALAQHDLKRLLAYHSVENIGIIALSLGMALLGRSYGVEALVALGLAGALLHVVNHGLFKSLLFLSAGAVIHATGTRELDHYGGLLKSQPWTGALFLGGAVAISGLPPFNGFISEWLLYLGAFGAAQTEGPGPTAALLAAPALALIGGLALACFVKVFGVTFLGAPRSEAAHHAHEAPFLMRAPMIALLLACAWIGLLPQTLVPLLEQAVALWSAAPEASAGLSAPLAPLGWISALAWVLLLALALGVWWLRRRARGAARAETWGCGYALPSARMQYSASSFADFLVRLLRFGLWSERHGGAARGLFPEPGQFASHTPDLVLDRGLRPAFCGLAWLFRRLRALIQNGLSACYLLYVALTLIVLLLLGGFF